MLEVKLVGVDTCRRYQLMREIVLDEAARAKVEISLIEENETAGILKYHTVDLPLLFIGDEKITQGNLPARETVQAHLRGA